MRESILRITGLMAGCFWPDLNNVVIPSPVDNNQATKIASLPTPPITSITYSEVKAEVVNSTEAIIERSNYAGWGYMGLSRSERNAMRSGVPPF